VDPTGILIFLSFFDQKEENQSQISLKSGKPLATGGLKMSNFGGLKKSDKTTRKLSQDYSRGYSSSSEETKA